MWSKKRRAAADGISDLAPQRARDERSGAEVYNDGRDAVVYELRGRRWRPYIERGHGADAVYVARHPVWSDGAELTQTDLDQARDVLTRVFRHWNAELEFVTDEPAP